MSSTEQQAPEQLPDAETTVLINVPDADEPVWLGWYDGAVWFAVSGEPITADVIAWAEMPGGANP